MLDCADLVDRDRAFAFVFLAVVALGSFFLVFRRMLGKQDVGVAIRGRLQHARFGYQFSGSSAGKQRFAHALWSGEQPCVMHPRRIERLAPFAPGLVMADQADRLSHLTET